MFRFPGIQQEFSMPMHVSVVMSEGDAGLLMCKDNLFQGFIPNVGAWIVI